MNYARYIRMLGEDIVKSLFVCNIEFVELWFLATYQLDTVQNLLGRIKQVVDDNHLETDLQKRKCGKRANEAGSSKAM